MSAPWSESDHCAVWCDSDYSEDEDDEYVFKGPVQHFYAGDKRLVLVRDVLGREFLYYEGPNQGRRAPGAGKLRGRQLLQQILRGMQGPGAACSYVRKYPVTNGAPRHAGKAPGPAQPRRGGSVRSLYPLCLSRDRSTRSRIKRSRAWCKAEKRWEPRAPCGARLNNRRGCLNSNIYCRTWPWYSRAPTASTKSASEQPAAALTPCAGRRE